MFYLFFSCLQGVQTQSNQSELEQDCLQVCQQYSSVCTQEQNCESLCTTVGIQISSRGCTEEAKNLWRCQDSGTWECVEEVPTFVGDACSDEEGSYIECITPEDTGALSN